MQKAYLAVFPQWYPGWLLYWCMATDATGKNQYEHKFSYLWSYLSNCWQVVGGCFASK
ncbi:hypothetical protein RintRC_4577 [Richelia intracellularis]|nr:hypothetical protein RintRC_4577 [Richelia intracellularis]